ncbi:MAG: 50S ribosomal protein L28 [Pirellulales bacterium]|nr:50S ribosomal protein L28 [Pirellulales bacterium]
MAKQCQVCGKKPQLGNSVTHRGKAKYLGGVGTKVTGISRRKFKPNLQRVHVSLPDGTRKTVQVCTRCIRSGAITKTIRRKPFKLAPGAAKK